MEIPPKPLSKPLLRSVTQCVWKRLLMCLCAHQLEAHGTPTQKSHRWSVQAVPLEIPEAVPTVMPRGSEGDDDDSCGSSGSVSGTGSGSESTTATTKF